MTEWIDHEAEAQGWIAEAPAELANAGLNAGTAERALLCAQLAQTEATLALAEQARIANLVSLAMIAETPHVREDLRHLGTEALYTLVAYKRVEPDDEYLVVSPDIARALRIGDGNE